MANQDIGGLGLQAQTFKDWPGDKQKSGKSSWNGAPFSNKSATAEFKSLAPLSDAVVCWKKKKRVLREPPVNNV